VWKIGVVGERPWQELVNEELFEWEALNGIRALAHLLTYRGGAVAVPVCVVGSFDGDLLSLPSSMPEILATALGERLGRDDFRLVLWSPRDGRYPFCELELSRVAPREFQQDSPAVLDPVSGEEVTRQRRSRTVRFANPRSLRRTEDEMAQLLGEAAIRELRSYAGQPGDYTPERLFGSVGLTGRPSRSAFTTARSPRSLTPRSRSGHPAGRPRRHSRRATESRPRT
jgi:hypothetical protein